MDSRSRDQVQTVGGKPLCHPAFQRYLDEAMRLKRIPCQDEQLMIGPPACAWKNFKKPLLRRYPHALADIFWECRLGGGVDGYVWQVKCSDQGRFALKVFWENKPPPVTRYWAFQRECQNAALLQMITSTVEQAAESSPICIHAEPNTRQDAITNLYAFSEDGRREQRLKTVSDSFLVSSIPRLKKCFGWLTIPGRQLRDLSRQGMAPPSLLLKETRREIQPDQEYFAIIYEYIPEGDNDPATVQLQLDFLWRAGFDFAPSPRQENWKDGVLVDLSEIVCPWQLGWTASYGRRDARKQLGNPSTG